MMLKCLGKLQVLKEMKQMQNKAIVCLCAIGVYSSLVEKGFIFFAIIAAVVIGTLFGVMAEKLWEDEL